MPGKRLCIQVRSVSFRAIEMGRHFHVNGITVNKTTQTVESAAAGSGFHIEDVYPLIDGGRFPVKRIVGAGERYPVGSGGSRLRIDPAHDPAMLFRGLA